MKQLATLFILLQLGAISALAQVYPKETNNWYFGRRAGIRFLPAGPNNNPVALADAAANLDAGEGTTAISDTAGNLLFYCGTENGNFNFSSVWNKDHQLMPNGQDLVGGSSSSQNALVVRKPGSFTEYYIFTVAQLENYGTIREKTFNYSKVDMSLDGGLGDIVATEKNIAIVDSTAEKVTAVLHRNRRDVWVISHRYYTNEFVAVLVTPAGVSRPVISAVGVVHRNATGSDVNFSRGCMKVSPNGNRIAVAVSAAYNQTYFTTVAKFDNRTGEVFDPFIIKQPSSGIFGPYGIEFSPDNSKLYIGYRSTDEIHQFDLCAGDDSAAIIRSKFIFDFGTNEPGTLQLGLDGKLYISKTGAGTSLARINFPNEVGNAANMVLNAVPLAQGTTCDRGLTNVNQSAFNNLAPFIEFTRLCERDTVQFKGQAQCQGVIADYTWDFGDTTSGALNSSIDQFPSHYYAKPGLYRAKLRVLAGNQEDTTSALIKITPLAKGTVAYSKLACKAQYEYNFLRDSSYFPAQAITNYRWKVDAVTDTTFRGANLPTVSIDWDSNQTARFALYLTTTTSLGESCVSDSIEFRVLVNQLQGQRPIGPDTICNNPEVAIVFTSPDQPRAKYDWAYTPTTENPKAVLEGQGEKNLRAFVKTPGAKQLVINQFIDTLNNICYTQSPPKRFFVASAPADSIITFGDSSVCVPPTVTYNSNGRKPTSRVHWRLYSTTEGRNFATIKGDTIGDQVTVDWGIGLKEGLGIYYLESQEESKDGCFGPITRKEVFNACLKFPNIVTANGDAQNQSFGISNIDLFPINELKVYNRWGKVVVNSKGARSIDKLTEDLEAGTYFYKAKVKWEGQQIDRNGWFEVVK